MVTVSNVVNASPGRLLCITYEILLEEIKKAQIETAQDRKRALKKAVEIIQMLVGDLNFEIDMAKDLFKIYVYVQRLLIQNPDEKILEEAYRLIKMLHNAYEEISKEEGLGEPALVNAEVIYAGMTYGKADVNEVSFNNINRGFKA